MDSKRLTWQTTLVHVIRHGICQKFYTVGFLAKNFKPSISPNFNSFSKKKHKKMNEK